MRVTFFPESAIGYVDYPEALLTRGLAAGLTERGHDVRIVEQRKNPALTRTLTTAGSAASRHAYERFPGVLMHSYQPRSGAPLMEWISRELSLIDVAVAVHGVQEEVARWIANLSHPTLVRLYLTFDAELLDARLAESLELDKYDGVIAPVAPNGVEVDWYPVPATVHRADSDAGLESVIPEELQTALVAPDAAALALERAVAQIIATRHPSSGSSASHSSN